MAQESGGGIEDDPVYCQLLKDFKNPHMQVAIACVGVKAAGKSSKMLALTRWLLENNIFDQYICFLPCARKDTHHSYAWMALPQFRSKITIFTDYDPIVCEYLVDKPDNKTTWILWDDLGGQENFGSKDPQFWRMLGMIRHVGVSCALCFHSVASQRTIVPSEMDSPSPGRITSVVMAREG